MILSGNLGIPVPYARALSWITNTATSSCLYGEYLYFFNCRLIIKRMVARTLSKAISGVVKLIGH